MKLEKKQVQGLVTLGVALVVFNVIAFAVPFPKNGCFWAAWAFGLAAILAAIPILLYAFRPGKSLQSKFYGFPVARVGVLYLVAQMIVTLLFWGLAFANCPAWVPVVVSVLVLAAAALGLVATDVARGEVERQQEQRKVDTSAMKALYASVSALADRCAEPEAKKNVVSLADELRYSDPISSEATVEAERSLRATLVELQNAVTSGDAETVKQLAASMRATLKERNTLAKQGK